MIGKILFFLGLWSSKFLLFIYKLRGKEKNDRPGLLAYKFSKDFIYRIDKPKIMIGVTGTNGKSTISSFIYQFLTKEGLKVQYNNWFANALAGHARCLLDSVSIFNKTKVDAVILEIDEKTMPETMPCADIDYLIVTNLSSDSLKRNGYPSFIASKLKEGFDLSPKTKIIMNADDPLCSFIPHKNPTIYYSLEKYRDDNIEHNVNDFPVCPKCFGKLKYEYHHYRHLGKVKCTECGLESMKSDFVGGNINFDKKTFFVRHDKKDYIYPINSESIFNVFNELSIIALFTEMGYSYDTIRKNLKEIEVPKTRENFIKVGNTRIDLQVSKGQNGSSSSIVFDHISNIKEDMEVILLINDKTYTKTHKETVTWIYETDFFYLKNPNIKRIIVSDYLATDYKVAMLLDGVPEDKIVIVDKDEDVVNALKYDTNRIMILFDVDFVRGSLEIRDKIAEKVKEKEGLK